MRHDLLYLRDILEATESIIVASADLTAERFATDRISRGSPLYEFIVIGEAASKLSADLRERYPAVPWRDIIGLRNVVAHGYFALQWERIWLTITDRVPVLREQIAAIIAAEFPEEAQ